MATGDFIPNGACCGGACGSVYLTTERPPEGGPTFVQRVSMAARVLYEDNPAAFLSNYSWREAIEDGIDVVMAEEFSKETK